MNDCLVSRSPLECVYSSPSSRSLPSLAASALTWASKRVVSAVRNATERSSSFAKDALDTIVAAANKTNEARVRRIGMNFRLGRPGRGCYDATRSPIDQTLSERPSLMTVSYTHLTLPTSDLV